MPNWVSVWLHFDNEEDCKKVLDGMQVDGAFTFTAVIPFPTTKEECPAEYIMKEDSHICIDTDRPWLNWYNWSIDNWGVKWDVDEVQKSDTTIYFETPWDVPYPVLEAINKKFNVSFLMEAQDESDDERNTTFPNKLYLKE